MPSGHLRVDADTKFSPSCPCCPPKEFQRCLLSTRALILQALGLAVPRHYALFRLRNAIAGCRRYRDSLENGIAALLLAAFDIQQRRCRGCSLLLTQLQFLLRLSNVGIGRFQNGAIGFQFLLQTGKLLFGVANLGLRSGRATLPVRRNAPRCCAGERWRDRFPAPGH